ncbi:U3 small nucleolar RNA-associated protein 6-domain-containing protein [Thelephora terrestris]|uniref:U3 small nucleolar RNA-associated protein 6-domain-containing protein n=1 Tax=Thelephora terrestris TaxID=56493 RepID=A0A9P6HT83_9AGAM|nr:U3 small nucleolar RNA-associated protein 6-domain-containing protein [Thelephora terrestris]
MERVEFQQEQMLAELKDWMDKGLFSRTEAKVIMKKRREFEMALVRRVARKSDFLRYAAYEMDLERLRRKRVGKIKEGSRRTLSDYGIVKRVFQIFERAVRKFKGDVGLWMEYIRVAEKVGAKALGGKITARAIQMHPTESWLYVMSANREMKMGNMAGARTMMERGIRMNSSDERLWIEWVKLEMGYIQQLKDKGVEASNEVVQGGIVQAIIENAIKEIGKDNHVFIKNVADGISEYPLTDDETRGRLVESVISIILK